MKKLVLFILVLLFALGFVAAANPPLIKAQSPVLITSFGQSPDSNFVRLLGNRIKLPMTYHTAISVSQADWSKNKTLIGVIGGSGKGLGQAGLDLPSEVKRCNELVAAAKQNNVKVILMHVGGEDRRGPNSEPFLPLAALADYLVVKSNGNEDGYFTKLASSNNIPLYIVETTGEIQQVLQEIFL